MFYDEDGRWRACSKGKHMDAGNDTCYMMGVGHRRLVPLGDEGKWQTYNNGKWTFIDGTKSLPLTGKELEDAKRKLHAKRINFGMKSHSSDDEMEVMMTKMNSARYGRRSSRCSVVLVVVVVVFML